MNIFNWILPILLGGITVTAYSQDSSYRTISLQNLDAFRDPGDNWVIAGDAIADLNKPNDIKAVTGLGTIVNVIVGKDKKNLFTKEEYGDVELELDFMMAKNSNSGIYLQECYEVQLLDSWTIVNTSYGDLGGIYARSSDKEYYEGTPPLANVAKAPGLWQHMKVKFRAPKFNSNGEKTRNAIFEEVSINGVPVQLNTEVTGPTVSSFEINEKPLGPIMFQAYPGCAVAFRNIRIRALNPEVVEIPHKKKNENEQGGPVDPIFVTPLARPTFIKTFLNYGDKKLTHVISVGNPDQLHYSYDIKQGALFQVWRGPFLDLTPAWYERGEEQLAFPLGSVLLLPDAPAVAILNDEKARWPDSVAFTELDNKGYTLNKQRTPVFNYVLYGLNIKDSIVNKQDGQSIERTMMVANPSQNVYCRIAVGDNIELIKDDLYSVNGKSFYIKIDKKYQPLIRTSSNKKEMLVRYPASGAVTYSLIW